MCATSAGGGVGERGNRRRKIPKLRVGQVLRPKSEALAAASLARPTAPARIDSRKRRPPQRICAASWTPAIRAASEPAARNDSVTPLLPRWSPINCLPISNRMAVTTASIQTSRQAIGVDGISLRIIANKAVLISIYTRVLTHCSTASHPGISPLAQVPSAVTPALTTRDPSRRARI